MSQNAEETGKFAPRKIVVRLTTDHKTGYMWFDEKMDNGSWVMIPSTKCRCQGNARHNLDQELERRRQLRLRIHHTHEQPETYTV